MGTAILTRARNLVRTKTPGDWPTGRQVYQHFAAPLVCKITSLAGKGKMEEGVPLYLFPIRLDTVCGSRPPLCSLKNHMYLVYYPPRSVSLAAAPFGFPCLPCATEKADRVWFRFQSIPPRTGKSRKNLVRSSLALFLVQQFPLVPAQDRHVRQLISLCPLLADRALDKERFVALPRQEGLLPDTVQPRMGSAVTGPQGFRHTVLGGCAALPARGRRFGVQSNAGSCRNAARKAWRAFARRKWAGFVPATPPALPPAGELSMLP